MTLQENHHRLAVLLSGEPEALRGNDKCAVTQRAPTPPLFPGESRKKLAIVLRVPKVRSKPLEAVADKGGKRTFAAVSINGCLASGWCSAWLAGSDFAQIA